MNTLLAAAGVLKPVSVAMLLLAIMPVPIPPLLMATDALLFTLESLKALKTSMVSHCDPGAFTALYAATFTLAAIDLILAVPTLVDPS